jgi:hypothetical protein
VKGLLVLSFLLMKLFLELLIKQDLLGYFIERFPFLLLFFVHLVVALKMLEKFVIQLELFFVGVLKK